MVPAAHKGFGRQLCLIGSAIMLAMTTAALPAFSKDKQSNSASKADDPNKQICRQVRETGSRLVSHRVCMTKAQWDEQRRQDRMLIERSQMSSCVPGAGC